MPLTLRIISSQKDVLGPEGIHVFSVHGGSIGRSPDNDWVLPDPERFLSAHHASIDYQGGAYFLSDKSTNGVFVNDADQPVGHGATGGDLFGQFHHLAIQMVVWNHAVGHAVRQRLGGSVHAGGEDPALGLHRPDQPGQTLRPARTRDDRERGLAQTDLGALGEHPQVARERELASTAGGGAADGCDRRHRQVPDRADRAGDRAGDRVGPGLRRPGGAVPPGAMPPGAMPPAAMPPGAVPPGAMPPA